MKPTSTDAKPGGTIVQSWISVTLAERLRAHAERAGCSISATIRRAIEASLAADGEGVAAVTPGSRSVRPGADGTGRAADGEQRRPIQAGDRRLADAIHYDDTDKEAMRHGDDGGGPG